MPKMINCQNMPLSAIYSCNIPDQWAGKIFYSIVRQLVFKQNLIFAKSISMCNYYGHRVSRMEFIRLKQIEKKFGVLAAMDALRSGFEYGDMEVVIANEGKTDIQLQVMHWEFIPAWITDMQAMKEQRKKGIPWLNAKSENLFVNDQGKKAMWADAARSRRCLVPMGYFFEWRHYKPEGEKKDIAYPYLIELNDQDYFYCAGIYNTWTDRSTGEVINTFAIVTTKANELMAEIHNTKKRQPAILTEDLAWRWIMEDLTDEEILKIAGYQIPSEQMNAYSIAKDFRTAVNPLTPFDYAELPALDIAE